MRNLLVTLLALLLGPAAAASADAAALEYALKAEFVERFTRFVEWPSQLLASRDSPFVICTAGEGPLNAQLEQVVARGSLKDHPARLRHLRGDDDAEGCHVLYIAPAGREQVAKILERIRDKPILSVGDTAGFAEQGVIINLFVDEGSYVRFEINADAARASGLKLSARLMSLARRVGSGDRRGE